MRSNSQVRVERMNERAYMHGLACKRAQIIDGKQVKGFVVRVSVRTSGKVVGFITFKRSKCEIKLLNGFETDGMWVSLDVISRITSRDRPWDISSEGRIATRKKKEKAKTKKLKARGKREWKEHKERFVYEVWRLAVGDKAVLEKTFVSMHGQNEKAAIRRAEKSNHLTKKALYIVQRFTKQGSSLRAKERK